MPPRLDIRLLGSVELRLGAAPLPPPESARAVSLLAYLLVHRGVPQPRRRVAFLLWPDSTEAQARTNLRKALHTLRRALPGRLPRRRHADAGAGAPTRRATLDLDAFERRARRRRPARARSRPTAATCSTAATTSGCSRSASGCATATPTRSSGWPRDRATRRSSYAERLVRHDPLREAGHRALMRLHAARGDRVRAMRAYHAYAALAQRELGIVPGRGAALALRSAAARRRARRAAAAHRAPLIGRARTSAPGSRALGRRRARPRAARARHRRAGNRQEPPGRGPARDLRPAP